MSKRNVVDITPHPRILQVLGEIEFKPWQCVAELVDNSVDGFLNMQRDGTPIDKPTVRVAFGADTVVVKDNGPGMSLDDLELAVKAGWTTNEKFGNLGLYGIGFNIATARLGSVTTIWTTRDGDDTWYGLEVDLPKMAKGGTYSLEVKTRTKSDHSLSGTEIMVSKVRPDWKDKLNNSGWLRNNVTERLSRIYGTMLRDANPQPIKFSLYINNKKVSAWEHCVWPADWDVYRKSEGMVRPIQEIDITFGKKYLSRSTGEIHDVAEGQDENDLMEIPERVYGWLGIQRYADEKDFGVDILRNGRKIEVGCKDIFVWEDEDGNAGIEYPIDDPRHRGRIVGEIHLDHGYVHYTKHRFEREHSSWKQLLSALRNNEPLTKRDRGIYPGPNTAPLGLLFRTFRRNSPMSKSGQTWKDHLFIKDNEKARAWAEKYRKGDSEYLDDNKWLKELESSDVAPPGDSEADTDTDADQDGSNGASTDTDQSGDSGEDDGSSIVLGTAAGNSAAAEAKGEIQRNPIPELNLHITGIGVSGSTYDVEVFAVESVSPASDSNSNPPWSGRSTPKGIYEIDIYPHHAVFNSTSLRKRDAVLAEVAYLITSEETARSGAHQDGVGYGEILAALRTRYATIDSLDTAQLNKEIEELRKRLAACLSKNLNESEQRIIMDALPADDVVKIELARATGSATIPVTSFLEMRHLAQLLREQPDRFFEAGCFERAWTPQTLAGNVTLLEAYRERLTRDIWMPLAELGEFANSSAPAPEPTRTYLALIRACVNMVRENLTVVSGHA